ncbi:MAG: type II secretion system GspH family protein [Azoarcus sp.]|jgi:prepilin-type N-terminal cleavage/methylation domain-containing protein|nr:type II secretion system GspH family protein [Azoarcus sp.]
MAAKGFTLLELLVVVAILSAVALASFGLVSEDRAQVRIDDTRNRLAVLRRAVLGVESPAYGGEMRLSGFVADNGRLPGSVAELLVATGMETNAGISVPVSSSIDSVTCLQTGGDPVADVKLVKGHRGNYLAGVAQNGVFRDGWGNDWNVSPEADDSGMTFISYGADDVLDDPDPLVKNDIPAENDQATKIAEADWRVALDGWQITLKNIGAPSASPAQTHYDDTLGVVLQVYENVGSGGQWRQFRNTSSTCVAVPGEGESCTLTFGSKCASGAAYDAKVPAGRHLLVLTENGRLPSLAPTVFAQVDIYPGALPPPVTLEVRQ